MRLYDWEIRLFVRLEDKTTEMNMKFGVVVKTKDFMKLKEELEQVVDKYKVKKGDKKERSSR